MSLSVFPSPTFLAAAALFFSAGPVSAVVASQADQSLWDVAVDERISLKDAATASTADSLWLAVESRVQRDRAAMEYFRPGYPFWQHIFRIPDGSVVFGSGVDGSLLAVLPRGGDWRNQGYWEEPTLVAAIRGRSLPGSLSRRREAVAEALEPQVGKVLHNPTRGDFLLPNARRYGSFVEEWGGIFERFGVPADIGLAQAILESGFNGRVRSPAGAIGFCQWLMRNWQAMKRHSPHEIEGFNQTTQVPHCAAYLTILTTKYGSFIPALSEHHAGGTNVGRTLINGERLGGRDIRESYFLGSQFAVDLRDISMPRFRRVVRSYGPRSYRYAEMVFGNTYNVEHIRETVDQERIYAMRAERNIPLSEITRRTGLSRDEVQRFNPALVRQVPRGANLYLPSYVEEFGPDVSFWHRSPPEDFTRLLNEFVRIEASLQEWETPAFMGVLRDYQRGFRETNSEEGTVMATVLGYVISETESSGRAEILREYRSSQQIQQLFRDGVRVRSAAQAAQETAGGD